MDAAGILGTTSAIAAAGFLSAFTGALLGYLAAKASKRMGRNFEGALTGFTAGLLIAFVCFKMLEEGFALAPFYVGVTGVLGGAVTAIFIDLAISKRYGNTQGINAAAVAASGVILHHFPEGLALGGMCGLSARQGLALAAIISVHSIPEAAAVFIPLGNSVYGVLRPVLIAAVLSLPVAAGSVAGALLKASSGALLSFSLTFSGGIMLYITCGEMLPASNKLWGTRLTAICSLLGFILGVVITS